MLSRYRHVSAKDEGKYSCFSFLTSALDGMSGQCHASVVLCPRGKDPRRLGGLYSRSGHKD
jgi:hypothetical protein